MNFFDEWPALLSAAPNSAWTPRRVSTSGGLSVGQSERRRFSDGGGKWQLTLGGIWLYTPQMLKAARAMDAVMEGGVVPVIVNTCERRFAPEPLDLLDGQGQVTFSDGVTFADGAPWQGGFISAEVVADVVHRAVSMTVLIRAGRPLIGGEAYSIYHAPPMGYEEYQGKRRYVVGKAKPPVMVYEGFTQEITFRRPARAAIPAGTRLDFDSVGSVMTLQNAESYFEAINLGLQSSLSPVWLEAM